MVNLTVSPDTANWMEQNHRYLMAAIAQTASYLQPDGSTLAAPEPIYPPAAIDQLSQLFGLSRFERAILLLGVGMELYPQLAALIVANANSSQTVSPTFGLALSHLPQAHWSAFTAESPLRRWQLIELGGATTLLNSPLRINERILHFLLGNTQLDPQLIGLVTVLPTELVLTLPPSQQTLVTEIVTLLQQATTPPLIQLCGYDTATKQAIITAVCQTLGWKLLSLTADVLPTDLHQLHLIQTLWEREAILRGSLLLLNYDGAPEVTESSSAIPAQSNAMARVMETCQQPLIIFSRERRPIRQRPIFYFEITQPTASEQRQLWVQMLNQLPDHTAAIQPEILIPLVNKLASHFSLSPLAIRTICTQVLSGQSEETGDRFSERFWSNCLNYARPLLEELAQPIRTQVCWQDLVLPDKEKHTLKTIIAQVRQRAKVYEQWGFANKGQRGLGISALFAGASGTGKTLAAEVVANQLNLDLYRIDLSSVVSKYIGETEKNLRRIFDAAEQGGAILLFDEADALFGKRSDVKDSHDRYANMEVAYLLQRMEAYRGLAILTTNLKNSLDQAFLRRLRFVVQFPFPDALQRAEIWHRVFPKDTPTENLSYQKLAKLNVPGGNIRNIALNAAFLAAEADAPVQMQHLLQAAQSEYLKLERPLTEGETKGWN
ncbi:ATP-binding protein [Trichocoleus sp. FACHB-262]|uniref:ATP-binding protein n=1 Tax=Trichocoleus sp. FACHB-262 TaxID=2692869 RepID=UPI0016897E10|nr:ATP-binding protein [Trichocoleus sp. FACHB-262]MBD2119518.1 ATP-binding protein [Trichocoleus sp. FACHB-262]